MAKYNLRDKVKVYRLFAPGTAASGDATSIGSNGTAANGIDLQGFQAAEVVVQVGASSAALSSTLNQEIKLQHSDSQSSGFADVPADQIDSAGSDGSTAGVFGVIDTDTTDENIEVRASYLGTKRYIRVFCDATGTVTGLEVAGIAVLARPEAAPVD